MALFNGRNSDDYLGQMARAKAIDRVYQARSASPSGVGAVGRTGGGGGGGGAVTRVAQRSAANSGGARWFGEIDPQRAVQFADGAPAARSTVCTGALTRRAGGRACGGPARP